MTEFPLKIPHFLSYIYIKRQKDLIESSAACCLQCTWICLWNIIALDSYVFEGSLSFYIFRVIAIKSWLLALNFEKIESKWVNLESSLLRNLLHVEKAQQISTKLKILLFEDYVWTWHVMSGKLRKVYLTYSMRNNICHIINLIASHLRLQAAIPTWKWQAMVKNKS